MSLDGSKMAPKMIQLSGPGISPGDQENVNQSLSCDIPGRVVSLLGLTIQMEAKLPSKLMLFTPGQHKKHGLQKKKNCTTQHHCWPTTEVYCWLCLHRCFCQSLFLHAFQDCLFCKADITRWPNDMVLIEQRLAQNLWPFLFTPNIGCLQKTVAKFNSVN